MKRFIMKVPSIVVALVGLIGCQRSEQRKEVHQAVIGDAGAPDADASLLDAFVPPSPPTPPEPTITAVREFTCTPNGVSAEQPVAGVAGTNGDQLVIRQTASPCQYDLLYRSTTAGDTVLSSQPSGYLLAAAADRVVCASPITHHPASAGAANHVIDSVSLDCALRSSAGTWLPMQHLFSPTSWAPWVNSVNRVDADTYVVEYLHDFSYQFANIGNAGRPADDGIYQQTLQIVGDTLVASGPPVRVGSDFTAPHMEDPTPGCPVGLIDPNNPACIEPDAGVDAGP